jgi:predicted nucleic acid-binding protein
MSGGDAFLDTSVVLYLLSADARKADRVEALLDAGGVISVQVLNELAAAAKGKLGLSWLEIREVLSVLRELCSTWPLTEDVHDRGIEIAQRYGFSVYDSMIVAAAESAGCTTLYTEDLQDRQVIDGTLTIRNPFGSRVIAR